MEKGKSILIVDDDKLIGETLKSILSEDGYEVVAVYNGAAAIEQIKRQFFNVVLLDLVLSDIGGIELLRMFSKSSPETCFIVLTGFASLASSIEALKAGAYDYIVKPFDVDQVKLVIKRGIERQELTIKNEELLKRLEKERYKLEIILEAYKNISGILKLDDLANFVTAKVIQVAEAEKSSLMVVDEASGELVLRGSKGLKKEKIVWRIKIGELIAGWVAKEGEALLVSDIDTDPRLKLYAKERRYKTKSFICLPLKADNRVIGVMSVTDKLVGTKIFTEDDLSCLTLLAHQTVAQIENVRLCEKLSSLAITDALTNIFNHRYFQEHLNLEIIRARRYKRPLTLIMFDVDSFKSYNDRYGHLEGDKILKEVARIMKQNVRQIDIVSRYGGEEFMIILPEINLRGARTVAQRIRKAVQKRGRGLFNKATKIVVEEIRRTVHETGLSDKETEKVLGVTLSGGVAGYREGLSKNDLISRADQALYKAKVEGKNKICVFE